MTKIAFDPALSKLLEDLPNTDPDEERAPVAEVWIAFCKGRHIIPVNVPTDIKFGEWFGPVMPLQQVLIHARVLSADGEVLDEVAVPWEEGREYARIAPGNYLSSTIIVFTGAG